VTTNHVALEVVEVKISEMRQATRGDSQGATVTEFLQDALVSLDGEDVGECPAEWLAGCADEVADWAKHAAKELRALKPVEPV